MAAPSPPETITSSTGFVHTYATAGDHTISISGVFPNIYINNGPEKLKIKKVLNLGTVGWTRLNKAFMGCTNLTQFTAGSTDTSSVTNMQQTFQSCTGLTSLDLSNFDTSSVTNMGYVFYLSSSLASVNVSSFNTSLVTDMQSMFQNCTTLASVDVSSFNTGSVANMQQMFLGCNALTSIVGVEDWAITGLNGTGDLTSFLTAGKMTTAQYDNLLTNFLTQVSTNPSIPAMTASFGISIPTPSPAQGGLAKIYLVSAYGWTIYDGVAP